MLKFNISSVLSDETTSLDIKARDDKMTHIKSGKNHYKLLKPIDLVGTFTNVGNQIIQFKGCIKTIIQLQCGRCTEFVEYPITIDFAQRFSAHNIETFEEDDIQIIEGNLVDLTSVVLEELQISIPVNVLCDEECKGLCNSCGINLNKKSCSCATTDVDPRLSVLKNLFKQ